MLLRSVMRAVALIVAVIAGPVAAQQPFDENKYPPMAGQWQRVGPLGVFDSTKPPARGQQAPLTREYQAKFEANLAEVAKGGSGDDPVHTCIPEGMPRAMNLVLPMEIVITRNTTYILMEYLTMLRRIYTDGRSFPTDEDPSWMGYSIGKWIDEDGDGRFDVLDVHFPTTDGRTLILNRYTELNTEQKLLVKQLKLDLPSQPPPRITASAREPARVAIQPV